MDFEGKLVDTFVKFKNFISRLELGKIEWKNHLERQNGAAEIFFHKIENSLRWILEGFW